MEELPKRLAEQISFIIEIDKLKNIYRQNLVADGSRRENDAEHSWHLAVMAFLLAEYMPEPVDLLKVIKMVLLHDVVEIDAGMFSATTPRPPWVSRSGKRWRPSGFMVCCLGIRAGSSESSGKSLKNGKPLKPGLPPVWIACSPFCSTSSPKGAPAHPQRPRRAGA